MDIRNLGNFASIQAVWAAYPNGGIEGDYLFIPNQQGTKYRWNKYIQQWENAEVVTETTSRQDLTFSDLNIQHELHVGSHADVHGDLRVRGVLRASHVKQPNVGLFATLTALQTAYPNPEVGMWATVGDSVPGDIYRCVTAGTWEATGETGGVDELENVVLYGQQSLTETEKKQARANLGFGNGDFATGSDFDNPDSTKREKVVTVGAVLDGADAVPTAGSDNLVKSGGVHSRLATIEEELGIPVKTEITENVSVTWAGEGFIRNREEDGNPEGTAKTWAGTQYSDFILIDKYTMLTYMRMKSTSPSSSVLAGISFYSEANESAVLVGKSVPYVSNAEERGYENQTIIVPQNAKYIRFSCYDEYVGNFTCEGKYTDYVYPGGLGKKVSDLQEDFDAEVLRSTTKDNQLEGSVNDLQTNVGEYTTEEVTTPISVGAWRDNYAIYATTIPEHDIYLGQGHADTNNSATDFVDISSRPSGAQLQYTNILSTWTQSNIGNGLCFYGSQKVAISGILFEGDALEVSYKLIKIAIPVNAKYVRFSFRINLLSNFSAAFVSEDRVYINGLGKKVDNLSEEVEDIKNTIAPPAEIRITPSICRRRFYLAMTEWCKNHGINDAIIEGAGGFGAGGEVENEVLGHGFANLSVADMTKILYTAYNYSEIENVLAETKHIAYTKGNERAILLESSWMNSDSAKPLTNYYKVMFGKTGGGQAILGEEQIMPENSYCLSAICYHEDFDDCLVLGVVRVKSSSAAKFPVFKQLMDLAKKVINNDASASAIATELNNNADLGHAMAIKLPFGNPRAYHHIDFDSANLPYLIYKKEPQNPQDKLFYPMSMIKILTAMVVLDYTKDLDVFLTITQEDRDSATSYSSAYSLFEGGEKLTIRDLLYASLLPSSNVANYVLARYVGQFLLETYNTNGFIPNN